MGTARETPQWNLLQEAGCLQYISQYTDVNPKLVELKKTKQKTSFRYFTHTDRKINRILTVQLDEAAHRIGADS